MRKISCLIVALLAVLPAHAKYSPRQLRSEVSRGLDVVGAEKNVNVVADDAPGALGLDVYQKVGVVDTSDTTMFIPTTMYVRMGAGLNLPFATDQAGFADKKYETSGAYTAQMGLGWNLSSYVRTEIDAQISHFEFSDLKDRVANYQTLGAMLYFDFARRYVQTGDVTRIRHFVPFMGVGAGFGHYEFEGADGSRGFVIAAPRATFGFNIMFNDLIGIDIAYQYQMMIGDGFGWGVRHGGVDNISNVIASLRVNF